MPATRRGQLISFSIEKDPDQRFEKWKRIPVRRGQTIARIAAKFGNPEDSEKIRKKNGVRGINYVLFKKLPKHSTKQQREAFKKRKQFRTILVPGNFSESVVFHVLAGDTPPSITSGYAKFNQVTRPERASLLAFEGYDAVEMKVPAARRRRCTTAIRTSRPTAPSWNAWPAEASSKGLLKVRRRSSPSRRQTATTSRTR
jgi:hypothetical protein